MPATINSGDMLVLFVASSSAMGAVSLSTSGWSFFLTSDGTRFAAYKIADGTEDSTTTTLTTANSVRTSYGVYSYYNHGSVAPQVAETTGTSNTPDPPLLTPSWGANDAAWLAVETNNSYQATQGISGYENLGQQASNSPYLAVYASSGAGVSTINPGSMTIAGSASWRAYTIGIKGYTPPTGNNALFFGGGF